MNNHNNTTETLAHHGDELHLLREIFRTNQVLMSQFSRCTGVPASRFALMRLLAVSEGELGIIGIAHQLGINPAAVTRQVQEMEREHLIERSSDAKDGRRSYVKLSPLGMTLFKQIHERTHELERTLASVLSAEDMKSAAEVLSRLRSYIEKTG